MYKMTPDADGLGFSGWKRPAEASPSLVLIVISRFMDVGPPASVFCFAFQGLRRRESKKRLQDFVNQRPMLSMVNSRGACHHIARNGWK
ncbi:MAG: hypothetical protein AB7O39_13615 [Flavobacteriaceae bacterium]